MPQSRREPRQGCHHPWPRRTGADCCPDRRRVHPAAYHVRTDLVGADRENGWLQTGGCAGAGFGWRDDSYLESGGNGAAVPLVSVRQQDEGYTKLPAVTPDRTKMGGSSSRKWARPVIGRGSQRCLPKKIWRLAPRDSLPTWKRRESCTDPMGRPPYVAGRDLAMWEGIGVVAVTTPDTRNAIMPLVRMPYSARRRAHQHNREAWSPKSLRNDRLDRSRHPPCGTCAGGHRAPHLQKTGRAVSGQPLLRRKFAFMATAVIMEGIGRESTGGRTNRVAVFCWPAA